MSRVYAVWLKRRDFTCFVGAEEDVVGSVGNRMGHKFTDVS